MNVPYQCQTETLQNIIENVVQIQYFFLGYLLKYLLAGAITKTLLHLLQNLYLAANQLHGG